MDKEAILKVIILFTGTSTLIFISLAFAKYNEWYGIIGILGTALLSWFSMHKLENVAQYKLTDTQIDRRYEDLASPKF